MTGFAPAWGLGWCGIDLAVSGLRALDVDRLAQIADRLDGLIGWLLVRSDAMKLPKN
jgi:hypothetical protein